MDEEETTTTKNSNHQNLANIPPEYQVYLHPEFDAQAFTNSILNNEPYHSSDLSQITSGDVSSTLSKLNLAIEDITKQLRSEVTTHHLKLLTKAGSIASLDGSLQSIQNGLQQIEINLERLQNKIGHRHSTLETALNRLDRYQTAAELTRRTSRFVTLAKRLDAQINELDLNPASKYDDNDHDHQQSQDPNKKPIRNQHEIVLAESALTLSELEKLLDSELEEPTSGTELDPSNPSPTTTTTVLSSIRSLKVIQPHLQRIVSARKQVESYMSKMLSEGLGRLDRAMLSSSFQTAYNLSILDQSIGSVIFELTDSINKRIKISFDINSLAREAVPNDTTSSTSFGYKSRARTEPTPATLPQWTSVLWARLEALIDDLTTCCVKVYILEQVLEWKKDPITGIPFLEDIMGSGSVLEERPSTVFWTTLSKTLTRESRETSRASNFITQTLTTNYPHLLRLFHEFFSRISVHTHTIYNSSHQSPETVLTIRAISPLENIYLNRSMSKMAEATNGRAEKLTAVLVNELDAARFDPLLVRSVARKVKEVVDNYLKRIESRIVTDYQSTSLVGPTATSSQITNIEIFNNLSQLCIMLSKSIQEYPNEIQKILEPLIESMNKIREGIIDPILKSIKRELSMVIAKMHHHQHHSKSNVVLGNASSGIYIHEFKSKLKFIRNEILGRLERSQIESNLIKTTNNLLKVFIFHASLMRPLSESIKLRLAADLAEVEFEISQFLVIDHHQPSMIAPDDEREENADQIELTNRLDSLKVFRQLIFSDEPLEVERLIDQSTLERLIVIHHLIIKHQSDEKEGSQPDPVQLKLIHQINSWTEAEYLRWVEECGSRSSSQTEPLKVLKTYFDNQLSNLQASQLGSSGTTTADPSIHDQSNPAGSLVLQGHGKWLQMCHKFINLYLGQ